MLSFFSWLRTRTRDAILAGIGDAGEAVDTGTADTDAATRLLADRLGRAEMPELVPPRNGAGRKRVVADPRD